MRVVRSNCLVLLAAFAAAAPLAAQIPTRRPSSTSTASAAPRMLVANPHSYTAQDSAPSIEIGEGLRSRMDKIAGGLFRVVTRQEMNDALLQFGYPKDAVLGPLPARSLAQSLNARAMVFSTLSRDQAGKVTVTARLSGLNDDAGNVVSLSQAGGQTGADLGGKLAEGLQLTVKAWTDARACVDQSKNAPEKAIQSAKKALTVMPTNGLANYCLGQLSLGRGTRADSGQALKYFQDAVVGDPLSLAAWTQIASSAEIAGDTTKTIEALLQMLRIAPTNQPLRDLVFKKLLSYGKPELAEQVATEGLALDPANLDLFELRANARIFRENYSGALDDLEEIVKADSTRADSLFYVKYLVTASQRPDSARLIRWSSLALKKFPDNLTLLKQVAGAYQQVGMPDSLLAALGLVLKQDGPWAVGFALQEGKAHQDAKDYAGAAPFIEFALTNGDATSKEGAAGMLLNNVLPLLQPPQQDFKAASDGLRRVVSVASPQGRYAPIANHFLGLSLVNQISQLDPEAEKQKSCDLAKQEEAMTTEAETALTNAAAYEAGKDARVRLAQYLTGLKPRTASMVRVYCK